MDGLIFWKERHKRLLEKAKSFSDVGRVAFAVQRSMPAPISQVCGPISTGGYNIIARNMEMLREAIAHVARSEVVFNQLPMEQSMFRIRAQLGESYNPFELLNEVYLPMFEQPKLRRLYFVKGWRSSQGSRWEHEQALRLGKDIIYLP